MASPFLGQVIIFCGPFAPRNWHFCDGSLMPIRTYPALFALLGTQFGGDGSQTFGLPDLRGRVPVGAGAGPGLTSYAQGQTAGTENVTLTTQQMPMHNHNLAADDETATQNSPKNNFLAQPQDSTQVNTAGYTTSQGVPATMNANSISMVGGNQAHTNIQPVQAVNYIIALDGIFPSRN